MENFKGKVAVVTGAASGIGRAMANRFAAAGMHVVLSDIEAPVLDEAVIEVKAHGNGTLGVVTDVSDGDQMDALAKATLDEFGAVHVVCNNAGVSGGVGSDKLVDVDTWKWVIDVNLWGVIHGHRVFVPQLLKQNEGHIVNTASMAGHFGSHSAYSASKWGVVGLTLGLHSLLAQQAPDVGVTCLCPGWVDTAIADSGRNRPEWAMPSPLEQAKTNEQTEAMRAFVRHQVESGRPPAEVADLIFEAVTNKTFWVFSDTTMVASLADKHDSIMEQRNPYTFTMD